MTTDNKYIVVNATALDRSGALSILRQFLDNIPDRFQWLVFTPSTVDLKTDKPNVRIEPVAGVKAMHKRLWWDTFGLRKWLKRNNIEPLAAVSLQNTGFAVGKDVPSFLYYHQPVPFFNYSWNFLRKQERGMWFYKHVYPIFVKLFLKRNTTVFVQLDFIKNGFVRRFNHPENLVEIYSPAISSVEPSETTPVKLDDRELNLFYPAAPIFYKNHAVLEKALEKTEIPCRLYITSSGFCSGNRITTIGSVPFGQVCAMYEHCDALVFPSYIETYGLPLLEAALTGMPVIAADLPYAKEVLDGYEGVTFVPYDKPDAWKNAVESLGKGRRYTPINISDRPSWKELFNSICEKV